MALRAGRRPLRGKRWPPFDRTAGDSSRNMADGPSLQSRALALGGDLKAF